MSYFTAVIAGDRHGWRARDVDVEDAGSLDDLADMLRAATYRDGPVLALVDHEDEWFALFRVDADDDPRVFVSDVAAALRSPFADLIGPALDETAPDAVPEDDLDGGPGPGLGPDPDDEHEPDEDELSSDSDPGEVDAGPREPWGGDAELLGDLGCDGATLGRLVSRHADDPAGALAEVGESCGFGELLDALR